MADLPAELWNQDLPNTKQMYNLLDPNLVGKSTVI